MNRHVHSGRRALGLALVALTAFLWGTIPVGLKMLVQWMSVYNISWFRFLLAASAFAPIVAVKHGWRSVAGLRRMPVLFLICIGSLVANNLLYQLGLLYISPGTAQIVIQLNPLFMLIGGMIIYREVFNRFQWLGIAVLIVGLILFFNTRYGDLIHDFGNYTIGVLLVVLAAVLFTVYMLSQKQLLMVMPPETILLLIYAGGVGLLLPTARPADAFRLEGYQAAILGCVALMTVVSYWSFGEALQHIEASRSGIVLALTPLVTVTANDLLAPVLPHVLTRERLNAFSILGAVLVISGSIISAIGKRSTPLRD